MLTINATLDKTSLTRTVNGLAAMGKAEGLTVQFVCWDAMRLWGLDMTKRTPPWANGKPGTGNAQKKAGQAAIAFDLYGKKGARKGILGWITDEMTAYMDWNDELPAHVLIRIKGGGVYLVDKNLYNASAGPAEIRQHHLKYRTKNGRVTTAGQRDMRIGRWKSVDKLFVQKKQAEAYVKAEQAKVGTLKAGWLPAVHHFAALSRGSTGRIPQWISRNVSMGSFEDRMDRTGNGTLAAINTAPHAHAIRKDTLEFSRKHIEKIMRFSKNGVNYRLQRLIDQFNAGKTPKAELRAA